MDLAADSTWVMSIGDGGTFPLFVRDALGISTPEADSIPRLTPPVPRLAGVEVPGIADGWDRWWRESSSTGPGREPIGIPDQLREVYSRWNDPRAPENTRRRNDTRTTFSATLHELITELAEELGHRPVFSLEIVQIPVEGQFWRRCRRDKVLVSEELMCSRNVIAPLESVIRDLVR